MKRSTAIKILVLYGVTWGGSIPWLIYLAAKREIPWSAPVVCTPIYLLLLYGLKPLWIKARQKIHTGEEGTQGGLERKRQD